MNPLKTPLILTIMLLVSACDVVNEKIDVADDAANRMVGKLDNSKFNQTINNSLDSVGDKATGFMPEAIRPPAERLRTDDSPILGTTPDPDITTPINTAIGDDARTESNSPESVAPEVAAIEPSGSDTVTTELPGSVETPAAGQSAAGTAAPPAVMASDKTADNSAEDLAEKELARSANEEALTQTFDMVELTSAGVTLKRVNIRLGPGTGHEVLDTIEAGTPLRVAGRTSNDWLLIERDGQPFGFILASLVRTDE